MENPIAQEEEIDENIKQLILKHLKDGSEKLNVLAELVETLTLRFLAKRKIFEILPQVYLHCGMAIRLTGDPEFENRLDHLALVTKHLLL